MTAVQAVESGRRQAKALLTARWKAEIVDSATVHDELAKLQTQWSEENAPPPAEDDGAVAVSGEEVRASGMVARANTLNLLAVAQNRQEAARIQEAVSYLGEFNPSRSIVMVADPERDPKAGDEMDVEVSLLEQPGSKDRPGVTFECVTVVASAAASARFASVASSLLITELPEFLWWPGGISSSGALFHDLLEISDRVIVDSTTFVEPSASLRALAALSTRTRGGPKLSDFTWDRLTPWRTLVAQFFDRPEVRPSLDVLERLEVSYTPPPEGTAGPSGLPAALLLTGWLASRLGWQVAQAIEPSRSGGYRLTMRTARTDTMRYGREIIVRLKPVADPATHHAIGAVELVARGNAPGIFKVQRVSPTALTTVTETANVPGVGRMVHMPPTTDPDLLGRELHSFGRDPIFEESLRFVASILPGDGRSIGA